MSHGFITRRMQGYVKGGDHDETVRVWPQQGRKTVRMASGSGLERTPKLTGVERLCYDLIAEAIVSYVQGDETATWWLFAEGVEDSAGGSAVTFADACDLLEWSAERFRDKIRAQVVIQHPKAPKTVLRDLVKEHR